MMLGGRGRAPDGMMRDKRSTLLGAGGVSPGSSSLSLAPGSAAKHWPPTGMTRHDLSRSGCGLASRQSARPRDAG